MTTTQLAVTFDVMLLDEVTLARRPVAQAVAAALGGARAGLEVGLTASSLRFRSRRCASARALEQVLEEHKALLDRVCARMGVKAHFAPLHPDAPLEPLTIPSPTLSGSVLSRFAWFEHRAMTSDFVISVEGVSPPPLSAVAFDAALLLALSASSPRWLGLSQGYRSTRTAVRHGLPAPTGGIEWREPGDALGTEPLSLRDLSLDVTVGAEVVALHLLDLPQGPREIAAFTALFKALLREPLRGVQLTRREWERNRWHAARHGLEAQFLVEGGLTGAANLLTQRMSALSAPLDARWELALRGLAATQASAPVARLDGPQVE